MYIQDFCEEYEIEYTAVTTHKRKHKPKWAVKKDGRIWIEVGMIFKLKEEADKLQKTAHEYYYYLNHSHNLSDSAIARALSETYDSTLPSWHDFLCYKLFRTQEQSIIDTRIPERLKQFVEFCEYAIPRLPRRPHPYKG